MSPAESPGKLAAAWVDGVLRDGVLILSVYLWHTEGAIARNLGLLRAAGVAASRYGVPWIIVSDFNMTPEELREDPGTAAWLKQVRGAIAHHLSLACHGAGPRSHASNRSGQGHRGRRSGEAQKDGDR